MSLNFRVIAITCNLGYFYDVSVIGQVDYCFAIINKDHIFEPKLNPNQTHQDHVFEHVLWKLCAVMCYYFVMAMLISCKNACTWKECLHDFSFIHQWMKSIDVCCN